MSNVLLPILPGNLQPGYCFTSWQQTLLDFSNAQKAVLNGATFFSFGPDKPEPQYQAFLWYRTTDGRWYSYSGKWRSPMNRNSDERRLWVGTLTGANSLEYYDGGSPGVVTTESGPAWTEDTDFQGRIPMAPGAVPGISPAKTLAVDENYGTGQVTVTTANLPSSGLYCKARGALGTDLDPSTLRFLADYASPGSGSGPLPEIQLPVESSIGSANMDKPIVTVPPVRGCYIIKPTSRAYYIVT